MSPSSPLWRVRAGALAVAVAAAGLVIPLAVSVADDDRVPAAGQNRHAEPAQAVMSKPLGTAPRHLRNLRRLADRRQVEPDRAWLADDDQLAGLAAEFAARKHWQGKVPRKRMPRSVGKLYTVNGTSIGECSAFAVRDPKYPKQRSYVVTAGHCLVNPATKDWKDFVEFYPRYYGKKGSPYGGWDGKRLLTYDKWYHKGNYKFDVGVVRIQRYKKKQIVDRVGGNRLAYGAKPGHKRVRFIGYPAAGKYDGKFPYQCVGRAHRDSKRKWMTVMPCATREGASGGPWFTRMINRNTGVAYAALSRGTRTGKRYITASPFRKSLRRIVFKQKW